MIARTMMIKSQHRRIPLRVLWNRRIWYQSQTGEVFSHFIDFQFNALVWIVIKFKETPHGHCHCHGHGELEEEEWLSEYYSSFLHKAGASLVGWGQGGDEMQLFGNHCENDNGFDLKSLWRFMVMEKNTPFIQLHYWQKFTPCTKLMLFPKIKWKSFPPKKLIIIAIIIIMRNFSGWGGHRNRTLWVGSSHNIFR